MKKWVFGISLLMILPTTEMVEAGVSYPSSLQDPATSGLSTNGPTDGLFGWRFRVNEPSIVVGQLGVNSAIGSHVSHTLTLFDFDTQAVLAQVTTTPGPGWAFEDLGAPVPLAKGSDYIVSAHFGSAGGYYYGYRALIGDSWFPTGTIEYVDTRYADNVGPSDFPTSSLTDRQYGIPDIGYNVIDIVPAPGATFLGGIGVGIIGWLRRRRTL